MVQKVKLTPPKPRPADAPKLGRPPADEVRARKIETILERCSNGDDLGTVCKDLGIAPATFRSWCRADKELGAEWQLARREYAHSLFDRIAEISAILAVGGRNVKVDGKDSWEAMTAAEVNAMKAAIDGYKHIAARLNPAQYGEQKAGQQGVVVMINTTLPVGLDEKPSMAVDTDFTVIRKIESQNG